MVFNSIVDCRTIYLFLFIWAEGRCGVVWCGAGMEWKRISLRKWTQSFNHGDGFRFSKWIQFTNRHFQHFYGSILIHIFKCKTIDWQMREMYRDVGNCTSKRCAKDGSDAARKYFPILLLILTHSMYMYIRLPKKRELRPMIKEWTKKRR